jgi:hypothetical protein
MEIEKESMMTRVTRVILRKGSLDLNNPRRTIFEEDRFQRYDPCRGELFAPLAELVALTRTIHLQSGMMVVVVVMVATIGMKIKRGGIAASIFPEG